MRTRTVVLVNRCLTAICEIDLLPKFLFPSDVCYVLSQFHYPRRKSVFVPQHAMEAYGIAELQLHAFYFFY